MPNEITVLITGASRGLGLELTRHHLNRGDQVIALSRQENSVLRTLQAEQDNLIIALGDVADEKSLKQAFAGLSRKVMRIDILYNNAGIFFEEDKVALAETKIERLGEVYQVNAVGPLRVCQLALPLLGSGSVIVNVSSEAASFGLCWRQQEYAYAMSKAALNMGSLILSRDLAEQGIRVLAVHPGWIHTDMGGPNAPDDPAKSAAKIAGLARQAGKEPFDPIFRDSDGRPMPW